MEGLGGWLDAVWADLTRFWPLLTGIGVIIGGIIAGLFVPILREDDSFKQIRDWAVKPGPAERYKDLIGYGLNAAASFYGPSIRLSWRGYLVCLLLAFIYPVLLFQLVWALDGPTTLAGANIFDEGMSSARRWISLPILWVDFGGIALFAIKFENLSSYAEQFVTRSLHRVGLIGYVPEFVIRAVVVVVAAVAVGAVGAVGADAAGAAAVSVVVVAAFIAGLVVVASAGGAVVVAGGIAAAIVAGGAIVAVVAVGAVGSVVYLTLYVIVPTANAVLDHASVQVSRLLLADLVRRRGTPWQGLMLAGHVILDAIAAGVFLFLLAVLLPTVSQLANLAFDSTGWPPIEWGIYLDAARREPFGAGLLVTGMLATTLVPTVLHLLAAGGALILPNIGGHRIEALAKKPAPTLVDRAVFVGLIAISVFLSWSALVVIGVVVWEAVGTFSGPLAIQLADLAEAVGRSIGGPGAPGR